MSRSVLVFGSRDWFDAGLISDELWEFWRKHDMQPFVVIHGAADGADRIAAFQAAKIPNVTVADYPPDYQTHGPKAPHVRNDAMLDQNPNHAYGFWDGKSPGTKSMIDKCIKRGIRLTIHVHRIPPR